MTVERAFKSNLEYLQECAKSCALIHLKMVLLSKYCAELSKTPPQKKQKRMERTCLWQDNLSLNYQAKRGTL
jgi:hypothetical protein